MKLNVTYDAVTLATAPAGFYSAVNYVVGLFDATFTNAATVNIEVGYGEFPYDGSLLTSYLGLNQQNNIVSASYSQVRQALVNEGAPGASTLPSTSPISGQLELGSAQEKALGLIGASSALDGWVGIASNAELQQLDGTSWSFSPTATPSATQYYLVGVIEHEFSEVMGRSSLLDTRGEYGVIDLYRYAAPGVRRTGTGDPAYFSIDSGVTNLDSFNDPHIAAGDLSDWAPNAGPGGLFHYAGADAFDNNSLPGQINGLSSTDLTLMAALGWGAAPVSPPPPPPPPAVPPPPPVSQLSTPTFPSDLFGDGSSDIFWQSTDGTAAIREMSGTTVIGGSSLGNPGVSWHIKATGDFNGDGKPDILWQNDSGEGYIWETNGLVQIGGGNLGNPGTSWHIKATGEFNGDGKSDILWQNDSGEAYLWEMNGTTVIASGSLGNPGASWHAKATGDFNADGKSDIVWQNDSGEAYLWEMNGATVIASGSLGNPGASWHIKATGEFNGDGKSDILWQNDSGEAYIWEMNGLTRVGAGSLGNPGANWHIKATGEFNGDGKSDILWKSDSGEGYIWEMNGLTQIGGGSLGIIAGSTGTASGLGAAQASATGFDFSDISSDSVAAGGAAATTDLTPAAQSKGSSDLLLSATGSTAPFADPTGSHTILFG